MYLNKVALIGFVGRVDAPRFMPNGRKVINFSIATKDSWKDRDTQDWKEVTAWHNLVAYGNTAELLEKLLKPKQHVYVEGKLAYRKSDYTGRDGVQVKTDNASIEVSEFKILRKPDGASSEGQAGQEGDHEGGGVPGAQQGGAPAAPARSAPAPAPASVGGGGFGDFDDDIPFMPIGRGMSCHII